MIKIEFNDVTIKVPDCWADIKLCDYEKWHLSKPETKAEYVQYVADVCGIDVNVLLEAPTQVFDIITENIRFVFDNEFEPANKITIDRQDYFVSLSDKLTLGEWVDIEAILGSDSPHKLSEMLGVLCRPAGEKYNIENTAARTGMFKSQPCDKVLPLISFFLFKKRESEQILRHYSTVLDQANQFLKDTETFVINGGGIKLLPIWQRIRYIYLVRSLKKQLSKFSDSSFTA